MSNDVLKKVKASSIYPDHVMRNVSKSILPVALVVSLLIHVAVLGVTSIGFVARCIEHNTLHPKRVVAELEEQRRREELAEERERRLTEAREEANRRSEREDEAADARAATASPEPTATGDTPIERAVNEVDLGRPSTPNATFDDIRDL